MEKTKVIVAQIELLDLNSEKKTRIMGETSFGRADSDVNFLKDSKISRKHFRLVPTDDVVLIEDLGSTNTTQVNGKRLKPNTLYKLRSRDVITFGKQKLQIYISGCIAEPLPKEGMRDKSTRATEIIDRLTSLIDSGELRKETELPKEKIGAFSEFIDSSQDFNSPSDAASSEFLSLTKKKGLSWYLQVEGSEFGPISFHELKIVVNSEQFRELPLFVWAEGLPTWVSVASEKDVFFEKKAEDKKEVRVEGDSSPASREAEFLSSAPLVATVRWFEKRDGRAVAITGICQEIGLDTISVSYADRILATNPFEIEVIPRSASGMGKFKLTVAFEAGNSSSKNSYVFQITNLSDKTREIIQNHLVKCSRASAKIA